MTQRWTCPAGCGRSYVTDVVSLPARCGCGAVDREGKGVTDDAGDPVEQPAKVRRYAAAVARWIAAGRPVRSDAEIDQIMTEHCSVCRWFKDDRCSHRLCGCQVRSSAGESSAVLSWILPKAMINKLRMKTERCPIGLWPQLDVLVLLTAGNPLWDISPAIERMGLASDTVCVGSNRLDDVRKVIQERNPRVVINRSFCAGWDVIDPLSLEFPHITWVTINHSSQAHLVTHSYWLTAQNQFLRLATERENCWYATPDERLYLQEATGIRRILWMPNLLSLPEVRESREPSCSTVVSLVGRRDVVKNFPAQIIAAGIVNRTFPVELVIVTRGQSDDFVKLAEMSGVKASVFDWGLQDRYLRLIADQVDVGMQASLTESFNYVATDHLGLGIPVVGSPAIRYLPRHWQSQPDDPASIAFVLTEHIRNFKSRQIESRKIAEDVASKNEESFKQTIKKILGSG